MRRVQPKRLTKGQLELEKIINSLGFEIILEKEFGNYRIDLFLPELNKGIEFDGIGHLKKRDKKRDEFIKDNFGVEILRIKDLKDSELKNKVLEFINSE